MWSVRYLDGASLLALVQAACTSDRRGAQRSGQAGCWPLRSPAYAIRFPSEMKLV